MLGDKGMSVGRESFYCERVSVQNVQLQQLFIIYIIIDIILYIL